MDAMHGPSIALFQLMSGRTLLPRNCVFVCAHARVSGPPHFIRLQCPLPTVRPSKLISKLIVDPRSDL